MGELTVIVTIYRVKDYLRKCIQSIQAQSYSSFIALLIVGSDDNECTAICEEYVCRDGRFRTVPVEPNGLSDARNVGIEMTDTKYLTFIDGDDYIEKDMLLHLMECIKEKNCDIAVGSYALNEAGEGRRRGSRYLADRLYDSNEALKIFLCGHDTKLVSAWGKIYKTSLFKNHSIRYPVGKLHEDNLTTYKLFYHARKIGLSDRAVYVYVIREGSQTHNKDIGKEHVIIDGFRELEEYLSDRDDLCEYIRGYETSSYVSFAIKAAKGEDIASRKLFLGTVDDIKRTRFVSNPHVRMRMKILCLLVVAFPEIMRKVLGLI